MNDQQIQILISLLEKIEKEQKEQRALLAEVVKQGLAKPQLPPSTVKIDFTAILERLDRNTRSVLGAIENIKPVQTVVKQGGKMNFYPLVIGVILIGFGLLYRYYLSPKIEERTRTETVQAAVRYYTVKSKRDKLSIDKISKSIDSNVYNQVLKSLKLK